MINNKNLLDEYQKQKNYFLDNLQPNDFRNGASFNQAETIIDELYKAMHAHITKKNEDPEEFILKAAKHLFRDNSLAVEKMVNLAKLYLSALSNQHNK